MNGIGDDQGVVTVGQRVSQEISLDHRDPGCLGLAGEARACGGTRSRQFEQCPQQRRVAPQYRDQERARAATDSSTRRWRPKS